MDAVRWRFVKSLFMEALEREPAQREAFLAERCSGKDEWIREVRRLLSAHETPTQPPESDRPTAPFLRASDRIGSYQVLRVLGEGGMGIVYLAEQDRPKRRVALKVIRPGLATPRVLKRFEHEAQLLGRLRHSGIAQVYEAGTANTGNGLQPYFAMELLKGRTLVQYAVESGLGMPERLDVFAKVCDAVQHAHDNGIVHRDLKPANILVDDSGQPKILDFGVARAMDAEVQLSTLRTDIGQVLGTIPYMSPEQAAGEVGDVDARSDVYSLGVVLFELLTETLPFDLSGRVVHEAARIIREEEPRRLSAVSPDLRGDIETMVAKALLKERARRYQSAAELAADIRRFLASEPIKARSPTAAYRIARFARQYRAHEAREALAITRFLQELLTSAESIYASGKEGTVRGILDQAARRLDGGSLRDRPELEADLRTSMGLTYAALGALEQSEAHLRAALAIRATLLDSKHPEVASGQAVLGEIVSLRGRAEEAESLLRRSIDVRKTTLGSADPEVAASLWRLADLLHGQGRTAEAETMFREAGTVTVPDRIVSAAALLGLSACLVDQGRIDEAEPNLRRCLEVQKELLPEGHWHMLAVRSLLGACLVQRGRHEEAEPMLLGAWTDLKSDRGAPAIVRTRALRRIVRLYEAWGRPEEAARWGEKLETEGPGT